MSASTPKRLFLCVVAFLAGTSAYAAHPSPRTLARMAFDTDKGVAVLFGGRGRVDTGGIGVSQGSDETWIFGYSNWAQRFPATTPPGRSAHGMVYDSRARRVVMFAGRQEATDNRANPTLFNDLWGYIDGNWARLDGNAGQPPTEREFPGMAFDPERNRVVVYGGYVIGGKNNREEVPIYDTWEFADGAWSRTSVDAPKVAKPILAYDEANKRIVMLGVDQAANNAAVMYRYDGDTRTWHQINTTKLPTCVNEGYLVYQPTNQRLLFLGGVCGATTSTTEEAFEFDGENWNKLTIGEVNKGIGQAVTWDPVRERVLIFGGTPVTNTSVLTAFTLTYRNGIWGGAETSHRPGPRSQVVFARNPTADTIILFGGLDESGGSTFLSDSWSYRDGTWFFAPDAENGPVGCAYPLSAFDTDRQQIVITCGGADVWEFDGAKWKQHTGLKPTPDARRFGGVAYDQKLKKTVFFGGFLGDNFRNDTWTWDGTKWAEVKPDKDQRPPHRASMAMWYDPLQQKTILYGGVGRPNVNTAVTRYADMWAFDGSRWTKLDVADSATPGARLRPLIGIDPTTNKLLLFGGLRYEPIDKDTGRQVYMNDTWQWDGSTSKWTRINTNTLPPVRQNGGLAWDPASRQMTIFGGNAHGFYLSDVWTFDGVDWRPRLESVAPRGRAVRK